MATLPLNEVMQYLRSVTLARDGAGLTDGQLLERFVSERDEAAFAALVRRHGPMVWGVCRRLLPGHQDAEDAFQATFLVLVRRAAAVQPPHMVANWLYGVAQQTARKVRTQRVRLKTRERQVTHMPEPAANAQPLWNDLQPILDDELGRLPDKYRIAILLCDLEGSTHKEAARQLGVPEGTLSGWLTRGRALLAKRLARRGLAVTSAALATALAQQGASAGVPAAVILATIKAGKLLAAGQAMIAGVVSGQAAALAEAMVKGMIVTKTRVLLVLLTGACLAAAGASLAARQALVSLPKERASLPGVIQPVATRALDDKEQARVDRFGDPLPPEATTRLGTTRFVVGDSGRQVFYAAGGDKLVISNLEEIIVYEAKTGKRVQTIRPVGNARINGISLSKTGDLLAAGTFGRENKAPAQCIQIFDLASGHFLRECNDAGFHQYLDVLFSPNGEMLGSYSFPGKAIFQWNATSGQEVRRWPVTSEYACFIFSPDSRSLIAGDGNTIHFRDTATGKEARRIANHPEAVYRLALSPDGKTLASQPRPKGQGREVSGDNVLYLWEAASGKKLGEIRPDIPNKARLLDRARITHFEFSENGKFLVTASTDGTIRTWNAGTGKEVKRWDTGEFCEYFALAPGGKTLAFLGGGSTIVRLWHMVSGREAREHPGHRHGFRSLAFSPDGTTLASGNRSDVRLWNPATGEQQHLLDLTGDYLLGLSFTKDGRSLMTFGGDNVLSVWETATRREMRHLQAPFETRYGLHAWSPDGKTCATVYEDRSDKKTKTVLWDITTGRKLRELVRDGWWIGALEFSPDGRSVYCWSGEQRVFVWDVKTGKLVRDFPAAKNQIYTGKFSPDGRWFICGGRSGEFLLYNMTTGKRKHRIELSAMREPNPSFAYSPEGRTVAIGVSDGTIHLLELATGAIRHRIQNGHHYAIESLAFSPDGRRLVSGSADTTALVWDLTGPLPLKAASLGPAELGTSWNDLKSDDGARAYQAIRRLAASPAQAIRILAKHLQPVPAPDQKRQASLIADLDSELFGKRAAATNELTQLAELAEPSLRRALEKTGSLEARQRIQQLLAKLDDIRASGERLRQARVVETLELIGNAEARQLLEKLARGAPEAYLTRDARASLARLTRSVFSPPSRR